MSGRAVGLQEKDPEHDEHRPHDDAPARCLPSPPEERQEEHEERGRPGQGDDDADLAEAQGQHSGGEQHRQKSPRTRGGDHTDAKKKGALGQNMVSGE